MSNRLVNRKTGSHTERTFKLPACPLSKSLQFYRQTGQYIDVILSIGLYRFTAHRVVLSASSSVLKERLSSQSSPISNKTINIDLDENFVSFLIIEDLLNFFYTSTIILTSENVHIVFIAAQHLNIRSLMPWCEEFFVEQLTPRNAIYWFLTSTELKIEHFRSQALVYILTYIDDVLEKEKLKDLTFEQMKVLFGELNRKQDSIAMNELLFKSVIEWAEHEPNRPEVLPYLLRDLQIDKLSGRFMKDIFSKDIIAAAHPVSNLLTDVLRGIMNYTGLYCVGGYERDGYSSAVSYLSSINSLWRTICPKACSKAYFGGAVVGRHIYMAGGWDIEQNRTVDSFEVFDCLTRRSSKLAEMPEARWHCAAVAFNGFIYVAGGWSISQGILSSMNRYKIETNKWEACAAMTSPRWGHQLVELNGKLYAIGGASTVSKGYNYHDTHNNNSLKRTKKPSTAWNLFKPLLGNSKSSTSGEFRGTIVPTVEAYDSEMDRWESTGETNYQCLLFGAAAHAGKIYVYSHEGFEVYSPGSGTWKVLPVSDEKGKDTWGRSLVSLDGKLLAIGGGEKFQEANGTVMMYEPTFQKRWTQLPDMDVARKFHCSFVVNY